MLENIKRRFHLGVYSKLAKIEQLIKQYIIDVDFVYINGYVGIKHLKPEWQEAMKQFGFTKDGVIFGVNYKNANNVNWPLCCISPGPSDNDAKPNYLQWLHKDSPGDYCWHWDDDGKIEEGIEECYERLQQYFMFMTIYIKQRNAMEKLIEIEWDSVQKMEK